MIPSSLICSTLARERSSRLFLKTRPVFFAKRSADLFVIRPDFRHRAIAPTVANLFRLLARSRKNLMRLGGDIHFLGPKIFAEIWVHGWE
jgi:hypothetical protein